MAEILEMLSTAEWIILAFLAGATAGWFMRGIVDVFVDVANGKAKL